MDDAFRTKQAAGATSRSCRHSKWNSVAVVLILFCGSGATCIRPWQQYPTTYGPPAPNVFSATPTLDDIITAVNLNAARVRSYATHNASITLPGMPGLPALSGSIAMERPQRFRLQAGTTFLGPEIDLGSNDEAYWVWVRSSDPKAVYTGRHALFAQSGARQIMPVEPSWFLDALGLAQFDPAGRHEGPLPRPDGKLEIRSSLATPTGTRTKLTVVDAARAWVLEQHVYDENGSPLASAIARAHRYFPVEQVSLPQRVEIHLPPSRLTLSVDVGTVMVNQLVGDPAQLWAIPRMEGYPLVSLDPPVGPPMQMPRPRQTPMVGPPVVGPPSVGPPVMAPQGTGATWQNRDAAPGNPLGRG